MSKLNPEKLSVDLKEGVTPTEPIIPRRYTLTHSDITAELFLTIGLTYAYNKINSMRDEVLGEWIRIGEGLFFYVYLYVDGQFGPAVTAIRNEVFRRELPLALEAIRYGDKSFFSAHTELDNVPIVVNFNSTSPYFNRIENWGAFSDYDISRSYKTPQTNYYTSLFHASANAPSVGIYSDDNRTCPLNSFVQNIYLLDMKLGDVNGDGILDKVFVYGSKPDGPTGIFADHITVVIQDGRTNQTKTITPEFNAGYNTRLFLGDFTKDKVDDIKVSIDSGGSGGYGFFYIYSFKNNDLREIFNFDKYNKEYKYNVDYADLYKVDVGNVTLNKLFILDISYKGYDYLSPYYDKNGKLKKPVQGEVLSLGFLVPVVNNEKINNFDLLAFQRIIGTSNADTLGHIENLLTWDGQKFISSRMVTSIPGTNLISQY